MNHTALLSDKISKIEHVLRHSLPGETYQNKMSPIEEYAMYRIPREDHIVACVMALLHYKANDLFITLIERASYYPGDRHAGQLGLPGGRLEVGETYTMCALRETEEEIGIDRDKISVLGALTPLYIYASNYLVYPFVGYLPSMPQYTIQEAEVAAIIEIPIEDLISLDKKTEKSVKLFDGANAKVPGYDVDGKLLWGATAMIASEIEEIFRRL